MTRIERLFVWLGGGAFVMSLLACAARYFVTWSAPPIAGSRIVPAIAVDTALFTLFAAHHSLFARTPVKRWLSRAVAERLLRSVYVWIASLLLLLTLRLWMRVDGDVYHVTSWRAMFHALVQLAGVWLIARSARAIDPLELAGIRQGATREELQITGPYKLVRHPLYLGWILVVFGAAHMTADRLTFAVITSFYLVLAIPWEERSLVRGFGAGYERYQRQVRWRVLPYVY
jgi:protein-S-isoprenylcysteine O-methyltransferase Ste14